MSSPSFSTTEFVIRTIAETACDNEIYFGQLDSVVGDGDFGYSLARGFEVILADWDSYDRERHRSVPAEDRGRDHEPDRWYFRAHLGQRTAAGRPRSSRAVTTSPGRMRSSRCVRQSRGSRNAAGPTSGIRP